MEINKNIDFLPKPKINSENLAYVLNTKKVYVNLFEIRLNKRLTLYQYPYTVDPPIGAADTLIRDKLFKHSNKSLKIIFGDYFISGDFLYCMKEIREIQTVKCS